MNYIPGLYKRIVDEMIVELNLLNHQNEFNQDYLFYIYDLFYLYVALKPILRRIFINDGKELL